MMNKSITMIALMIVGIFFIVACGGGGGGETSYTLVSEPNISVSETSPYSFGGVVLNRTTDRAFTVTNNGTANGLVIGTIPTLDEPFSVTSDNCSGATLAKNATCSFVVRFTPTAQAQASRTLTIPSNVRTVNITLNGEGYGLNVWINQIDASDCTTLGTISVSVTVTNPLIPLWGETLGSTNFTLLHNGGSPQTINDFDIVNPDDVSVVLALDLSSSLTDAVDDIKTAAKGFIDLLRYSDSADYSVRDEAAICKFKATTDFYPVSDPYFQTTDAGGKTLLQNYIDSPFSATDGTALYDAVFLSIERATQGSDEITKRAVIVLSDGADNASVRSLQSVIDEAKVQGIPVFTIFYVDPAHASTAKPLIMQQLANDTGGQYYNSDTTNLADIFTQISNILSNKYTFTYTPATCAGSMSLRVDWSGLYGVDLRTIAP
ncbi:MAG: choice-of-anchor D domain-containing protein [Smithellaceae bacterium]